MGLVSSVYKDKELKKIEGQGLLFSEDGQWFISHLTSNSTTTTIYIYHIDNLSISSPYEYSLDSNYQFDLSEVSSIAVKTLEDEQLRIWLWANQNKTLIKYTYYSSNRSVDEEFSHPISTADSLVQMKTHPTKDYVTIVKKEGITMDSWLITLINHMEYSLEDNQNKQTINIYKHTDQTLVDYFILRSLSSSSSTKLKRIRDNSSLSIISDSTFTNDESISTKIFQCNNKVEKCIISVQKSSGGFQSCIWNIALDQKEDCEPDQFNAALFIDSGNSAVVGKNNEVIEMRKDFGLSSEELFSRNVNNQNIFFWTGNETQHIIAQNQKEIKILSSPDLKVEHTYSYKNQERNALLSTSQPDNLYFLEQNEIKVLYVGEEIDYWPLIGGVVGGVVFVLILAFVIYRIRKGPSENARVWNDSMRHDIIVG